MAGQRVPGRASSYMLRTLSSAGRRDPMMSSTYFDLDADHEETHVARSGTAVVVGGSIGGTLAARVLADRFERVVVLDRDELPAEAVERKGAPQALHSHGLLVRGRQILEELFPGITDELIGQGAILDDMQRCVHFYTDGRRLADAPSDLMVLAVSRPLLETQLRRRVAALPGVTIRDRTEVVGLLATEDSGRVTGVTALPAGTPLTGPDGDSQTESIAADLVVDASGRTNRSLAWLTALGYDAPEEISVKAGIVYATQEFRRSPTDNRIAVAVGLSPESPRGSATIAAEGDRWICTLVGTPGQEPTADPEEFVKFAETLSVPDVGALLRDSQPLGEVVRMRLSSSSWRRYDKLTRLPDRYLVFGDALCYLNPTYGQGMTVAAAEALVLRDVLARGLDNIGKRFFAAAKAVVSAPWSMSAGGDMRFPWVEGPRQPGAKFLNSYIRRLTTAAATDPKLAYAFLRVVNMLSKPPRLMAPDAMFRTLRPRRREVANTAPQ